MNTQLQKLLRLAISNLLTIMIIFTFTLAGVLSAPGIAFAQRFEAEDAFLSPGFLVADNHPGFSGTGFVDYVGEGYVEWLVDVAGSGRFLLSFRYALASGDRPQEIDVNGVWVSQYTEFPATGAWDQWDVVQMEVALNAGTNTVRAQTVCCSGANMDRLDVTLVASPSDRFVDNGDGTITDNETGLMWEKKDAADGVADHSNPQDVDNTYAWTDLADGDETNPDGDLFTEFLALLNQEITNGQNPTCFANHCDWRIPRIVELESIVDMEQCHPTYTSPCIDPVFYPTAVGSEAWNRYWSSSTPSSSPESAWGVNFGGGDANTGLGFGKEIPYWARAVRYNR